MKKQIKKTIKKKNLNKNVNKISKKMSFSQLIYEYPEATEVLLENGMHCFGCAMASFETLEQGCLAHGIDADRVVKELNKNLNKNNC